MSIEGQKFHPGDEATPQQILQLAEEYRHAAEALFSTGRRKSPVSRAPYRSVAIHAIELYLNALMRSRGLSPEQIRAMQHNMAQRALFAKTSDLNLRKATVAHLIDIASKREYLNSRYGAEMTGPVTPLNRLTATLKEIGDKVTKAMRPKAVTK